MREQLPATVVATTMLRNNYKAIAKNQTQQLLLIDNKLKNKREKEKKRKKAA